MSGWGLQSAKENNPSPNRARDTIESEWIYEVIYQFSKSFQTSWRASMFERELCISKLISDIKLQQPLKMRAQAKLTTFFDCIVKARRNSCVRTPAKCSAHTSCLLCLGWFWRRRPKETWLLNLKTSSKPVCLFFSIVIGFWVALAFDIVWNTMVPM